MLTVEQYQSIVDNYDRVEPYGALTDTSPHHVQYADKDVYARRWHLKKGKQEIALIHFLELTFEQFIERLDTQCALQYSADKDGDWTVTITSDDNKRSVTIERKELNRIVAVSSYEADRVRNTLFELPKETFENIRNLVGCPDNSALTESEERMIANALFEVDMQCLVALANKEVSTQVTFNRVDGIGKATIAITLSDVKQLNRLNVSCIDEAGNRTYKRSGE